MIAAAVLLFALGWIYGRVAWGLAAEWTSSPDASYGLVLAAAAAFLFWRRRTAFWDAVERGGAPSLGATAALLAGVSMFVVGQLAADVFVTRASLIVVIVAALWFVAGARAVRTVAAPLAFLAIAIPLPALVVNAVTLPLQLVASRIAESTLATAGVPVFRDGNLLTLPSTTLEVAEACSGLRSLISLAALGVLLAWITDGSLWKRAAIVAFTVPIAIVTNGLRIAFTGFACEIFGPDAASGGWHTFTGWATFVASVAVLEGARRAALKGCAADTRSSVQMEREALAERAAL